MIASHRVVFDRECQELTKKLGLLETPKTVEVRVLRYMIETSRRQLEDTVDPLYVKLRTTELVTLLAELAERG